MKFRNLVILLGLVVATVVTMSVFMDSPGSNEAPGAEQELRVSPVGSPGLAENAPAKEPFELKRLSKLAANPEAALPSYSAADFDRFIARHGESAANLVTAFEQGGDRKWLERALELYPDVPLVLISAIVNSPKVSAEVRRGWIDRLKMADSANPVPWILSASELFKDGRSDEALADAAAALERPGFYMYASERIAASLLLHESNGLHPLESEFLASVGLTMPLLAPTMAISKALENSKSGESATPESVAEAARIQYGLGKIFQTPEASRTLISQLVGISIESKGLATLSSDEQARRTAEIAQFKASVKELTEVASILAVLPNEERLAQYVRRLRTDGELAAMRWLQSQEKK